MSPRGSDESLLDAAGVGPEVKLLDVATGPGYVTARAAERGASVVGLDVAGEMVALARTLHPQIEFRQGDAERLPFEDASFDALVGNFLVLHLGRPEHAAAEFARVLGPGGRVALSTWDPARPGALHRGPPRAAGLGEARLGKPAGGRMRRARCGLTHTRRGEIVCAARLGKSFARRKKGG